MGTSQVIWMSFDITFDYLCLYDCIIFNHDFLMFPIEDPICQSFSKHLPSFLMLSLIVLLIC